MLYDLLSEYNNSSVTPFHMPGHKRNAALLGDGLPYSIDVTEIDGFDDLHDPRGVLKELSDLAARLYGCRRAFPLVNGATGGILAAIRCAAGSGDTVVMARNCHRSVYNAVLLGHLKPAYLLPEIDARSGVCGSITPAQVAGALDEHPSARLVIVTSPTYEGITCDIAGICDAAHRRNVPVLVDAAHGAHLGFSEAFPPSAVRCGADIAVVSLHKTLPALTQCALALLNSDRLDESRFQANLSIYQTSSPSYVLLSSIDRCVRLLLEEKDRLFGEYAGNLTSFSESVTGLKRLKLLCHGADTVKDHPAFYGFDPGKLVVVTRGTALSGPALLARLRSSYRLELEMAAPEYVIAMTSVCDGPDAFDRLSNALLEIDGVAGAADGSTAPATLIGLPVQAMTPGEAESLRGEALPLHASAGQMSLEYVWAYPPGVPFLVPGEIISASVIEQIDLLAGAGLNVKSTTGMLPRIRTYQEMLISVNQY
jgi:arginine/lysine/ornithine decarboxylase